MDRREKIEKFLGLPSFALVGASSDKRRFGFIAFDTLVRNGFNVAPVNKKCESIGTAECRPDLASLPEKPEGVIIIASKSNTVDILASAISCGIGHVWIQQGCDSPRAMEMAKAAGLDVITGHCILMHAAPVKGVHKFHRVIVNLFGRLYK